MNQIILTLALVAFFLAVGVQLARTLRSDGYGKRTPPPSRHEEVATFGYRSLV